MDKEDDRERARKHDGEKIVGIECSRHDADDLTEFAGNPHTDCEGDPSAYVLGPSHEAPKMRDEGVAPQGVGGAANNDPRKRHPNSAFA